jgi:hypothetical protein
MRRTVIAASRRTPCFRGQINACPGRSRPAHAPRGARSCPQNLAPRLLTHRCACGEAPDTAQSSRFATCLTGPAVSPPSVSGRCSAMPSTIPICRPFREARRVRKRSGGDTEVLCAAGAGNKNPRFPGIFFRREPSDGLEPSTPLYEGGLGGQVRARVRSWAHGPRAGWCRASLISLSPPRGRIRLDGSSLR